MRFEVHIHDDRTTEEKLDLILRLLGRVIRKENEMAGELDALTAQVARNTEVEASALVLIRGIAAQLAAAIASGDPIRLTSLSATLSASADALAAAILENTPAVP